MRVGTHVPAGDPLGGAATAGADVVQLHLSAPRQWRAPKQRADAEQLRAADLRRLRARPVPVQPRLGRPGRAREDHPRPAADPRRGRARRGAGRRGPRRPRRGWRHDGGRPRSVAGDRAAAALGGPAARREHRQRQHRPGTPARRPGAAVRGPGRRRARRAGRCLPGHLPRVRRRPGQRGRPGRVGRRRWLRRPAASTSCTSTTVVSRPAPAGTCTNASGTARCRPRCWRRWSGPQPTTGRTVRILETPGDLEDKRDQIAVVRALLDDPA